MALADVLRARAAFQGRAAQIECGELGLLTVESLPVRELELLLQSEDGYRAVFYAACRDLQLAGEQLLREGRGCAPDGILQFVSDAEAEAAAMTVFDLSGWTEKTDEETETEAPAAEKAAIETHGASAAEPAETGENFAEKTEAAGQNMPVETELAGVKAKENHTDVPAERRFVRTAPQNEETGARQAGLLTKNMREQAVPHEVGIRKRREGKVPEPAADKIPKKARPVEIPVFGGEKRVDPAEAAANGEEAPVRAEQRFAEERAAVRAEVIPLAETLSPAVGQMRGESISAENNTAQSEEARKTAARKPVQETVWCRGTVREEETALADRVARRLLEGLRRANMVKGD